MLVSKYSGYPFFCNIVCQHRLYLCLNKVNTFLVDIIVRNDLYNCVKILRQCLVSILISVLQPASYFFFSFTSKYFCFTSELKSDHGHLGMRRCWG